MTNYRNNKNNIAILKKLNYYMYNTEKTIEHPFNIHITQAVIKLSKGLKSIDRFNLVLDYIDTMVDISDISHLDELL
jgi:hypothetical protein